ncbi:MAG TPA: hypothetical protein VFW07_03000 [Parafilimonas sp.]|nr:hypothetical protein [Parafilimonas sp.]
MKMRNDDLKKITEIKQYLLDPPVTFKLYDYALNYVADAIKVLAEYAGAEDTTGYFQNLKEQLENRSMPQEELRGRLKEAGIQISKLTSK